MMNGMSLHPYPKGAPVGRQISIPPFDMTSHPLTSLPDTDTNQISAEKCSRSRAYPWSKDIQRSTRLPKHKVDDKASSKIHLVRSMHSVVTSKFKIFSVAKTRCKNTMASVTMYLQCCCLPTTHKTTTTEQHKQTHTHTHETQDET